MSSKLGFKLSSLKLVVSTIAILVVINVLFHALQSFLYFKGSVQQDLEFSSDTLKIFAKEYVERTTQKYLASPLPEDTDILQFYLYLDEGDINRLNRDLPGSGKSFFVGGHISEMNSGFSSRAEFRYRGGLPLHWYYEKKSFRVKLPDYSQFNGAQSFNLVNPSTIETIVDQVSNKLSKELGLLTPDYLPARVFINGEFNGVHYYLEQVSESFLRKNKRMPGSIYSGDNINVKDYFGGKDSLENSMVYKGQDGTSLLWQDERLWEKDAARNAEQKSNREDIKQFLEIINNDEPDNFYWAFNNLFDKESFYKFWGLDTVLGGYHHDNFHNHKIYFDPYKGKFEPIQWDIRFWSSGIKSKNLPVNKLLLKAILNPHFEFERDKVTYDILQRFPSERIHGIIQRASDSVRSELAADPYRQAPEEERGRFKVNKVKPFRMIEFENSVSNLKSVYRERTQFIQNVLEDSKVEYAVKKLDNNQYEVSFSSRGNSPAETSFVEILSADALNAKVVRQLPDGSLQQINVRDKQRFYPGRAVIDGNALGRLDSWAISAYGREFPVNSSLEYKYIVETSKSFVFPDKISAVNSVTGSDVFISKRDRLADSSVTDSVHPWKVETFVKPHHEIVFSGRVEVKEELLFTSQSEVLIKAGTEFVIWPGKSLVFRGKLSINGSKEAPVIFRAKSPDSPWGSIVVHGKETSGSVLKGFKLSGGSITQQQLVNYPGALNIHESNDFVIEDCLIESTQVGDDALHVAYSKGKIFNCEFRNTPFDAIDIDISNVHVSKISFSQIGNDALDVMTSTIQAKDLVVDGAGDKCISIGEESNVFVSASKLKSCNIGIAVKDKSIATIKKVEFIANDTDDISLYRKNPRYNLGGTLIYDASFDKKETSISLGPYSSLTTEKENVKTE